MSGPKLNERTPQTKLDALEALPDSKLLEKAWAEISALCGADKGPQKRWTMSIPVDAERDSDILFGEVLRRYAVLEAKLEGYERRETARNSVRRMRTGYRSRKCKAILREFGFVRKHGMNW